MSDAVEQHADLALRQRHYVQQTNPVADLPFVAELLWQHRRELIREYADAAQRHFVSTIETAARNLPEQRDAVLALRYPSVLTLNRAPGSVTETLRDLNRVYEALNLLQHGIDQIEDADDVRLGVTQEEVTDLEDVATTLGMAVAVHEACTAARQSGTKLDELRVDQLPSLLHMRARPDGLYVEAVEMLQSLPQFGRALTYEVVDNGLLGRWHGNSHNPRGKEAAAVLNEQRHEDFQALRSAAGRPPGWFYNSEASFDLDAELRHVKVAERLMSTTGSLVLGLRRDRFARENYDRRTACMPLAKAEALELALSAEDVLDATIASATRELHNSSNHRDRRFLHRITRLARTNTQTCSRSDDERRSTAADERALRASTNIGDSRRVINIDVDDNAVYRENSIELQVRYACGQFCRAFLIRDLLTQSRMTGTPVHSNDTRAGSRAFRFMRDRLRLDLDTSQLIDSFDDVVKMLVDTMADAPMRADPQSVLTPSPMTAGRSLVEALGRQPVMG